MAKAVLLVCFGLLVASELLINAAATPDTNELQQGRTLLQKSKRGRKEYTALAAAPGAKTGTDKVPAAPQAKMAPTATASMVPKKAAVPAAKAATAPVKTGRLLLLTRSRRYAPVPQAKVYTAPVTAAKTDAVPAAKAATASAPVKTGSRLLLSHV